MRHWLIFGTLAVGVGILADDCVFAEDPEPPTAPPIAKPPTVEEVIQELLSAAPQTDPVPTNPPGKPAQEGAGAPQIRDDAQPTPRTPLAGTRPALPPDPAAIIDSLVRDRENRRLTSREDAKRILTQAQQLAAAGDVAEAARLAKRAAALLPNEPAIREFLAQLPTEARAPSPSSTNLKVGARMSAALTRAQLLLREQRSAEAMELLEGILEGCAMFAEDDHLNHYRDIAQRELIRVRGAASAVDGPVNADLDSADSMGLTAEGESSQEARPRNFARLLEETSGRWPRWYLDQKSRLRQPMSIDVRRESAQGVLEEVAQVTGLTLEADPILVHSQTVARARVDLRLSNTSAETILDLVGQQGGFEYVLSERGIILTTSERARRYLALLPSGIAEPGWLLREVFPDLPPIGSTRGLIRPPNRTVPASRDSTATVPSPPGPLAGSPEDSRNGSQTSPQSRRTDVGIPGYLRSRGDFIEHLRSLGP